MSGANADNNILTRWWEALKRRSALYAMGSLVGVGVITGVVFWGGFNTAMEATNQEAFCISCHEMEENVYREYKDTIHYNNRSGVRATCPDCHVPNEWTHKVVRKIQASKELYGKVMGTIDTPEKFEAKRLTLAQREWNRMKKTDSRECRNCLDYNSMDYTKQGRRGRTMHIEGFDAEKTCIDCHKGIAHSLPAMIEVDPSAAMGDGRRH